MLLGEQQRIVGIRASPCGRRARGSEKPRVSAFTSAKIDKILALQPDLVIGFSDLQADIAATLIRAGVEVHGSSTTAASRHPGHVRALGGMVGCEAKARGLRRALRAPGSTRCASGAAPAAPAARVLRRMGRAADQRHPLGRRAGRHGRRRRHLSRSARRAVAGPRPHRRRSARGGAPRARHHHRLVVRQEVPPRAGGRARPAGRECRRCATANCTKSSRR